MTDYTDSAIAAGFSPDRLARIAPGMQRYIDEERVAGFSMMVARRGQLVYREQIGWMDVAAKKPVADDTIYRIYSMTKPVVCTALMTLFEEGRLQISDPVAKYLPAFAGIKVQQGGGEVAAARPPTVRSLLTHTSGLSYDYLEDFPVAEQYRQAGICANASRTLEQMIAELARFPLAYQPETRWHYGLGIDVAAHLVEVIAEVSLSEFLQQRIFAPLGMADTAFRVPQEQQHRLAQMYGLGDFTAETTSVMNAREAPGSGIWPLDVSVTYPIDDGNFARGGHGLYSTLDDYFRFAQMLLNGGELDGMRIIGRKTLELMHANHLSLDLLPLVNNGVPNPGYGFGLGSRVLLDVAATGLPGSVGEYGWAGAARTYYWVDPHEEIVGLMMAQKKGIDAPQRDYIALVYQALVD